VITSPDATQLNKQFCRVESLKWSHRPTRFNWTKKFRFVESRRAMWSRLYDTWRVQVSTAAFPTYNRISTTVSSAATSRPLTRGRGKWVSSTVNEAGSTGAVVAYWRGTGSSRPPIVCTCCRFKVEIPLCACGVNVSAVQLSLFAFACNIRIQTSGTNRLCTAGGQGAPITPSETARPCRPRSRGLRPRFIYGRKPRPTGWRQTSYRKTNRQTNYRPHHHFNIGKLIRIW